MQTGNTLPVEVVVMQQECGPKLRGGFSGFSVWLLQVWGMPLTCRTDNFKVSL